MPFQSFCPVSCECLEYFLVHRHGARQEDFGTDIATVFGQSLQRVTRERLARGVVAQETGHIQLGSAFIGPVLQARDGSGDIPRKWNRRIPVEGLVLGRTRDADDRTFERWSQACFHHA